MSEPRIINLTPHAITIAGYGAWTLAPSGKVARAIEVVVAAQPIDDIPTSYVQYDGVEDLPDPLWTALPNPCDEPGAVPPESSSCLACGATDGHVPGTPRAPAVYYVVSSITADVARRIGRTTEDLLTPGHPIRDDAGRIIGCRSLARVR